MASTEAQPGTESSLIPLPPPLTINVVMTNQSTTEVIPTVNSTVSDVPSPVNVTTDVIPSENFTTVDIMTSTSNVTSNTSDVISTVNVTVADIIFSSSSSSSQALTSDVLDGSNVTNVTSSMMTMMTTSINVSSAEEVIVLEQRIADSIDLWVPPFLFFIGVIANVLVILVMQSKYFRHMSTSFYMSVSSIVDMASLLVSLPAHYLYVNFPQVFKNVRDAHAMCSFFNLFGWGSSDMGVLLTVAMTTERSLAIQFPLKAPTLCTVKRAKIVTFCLFLLEILKVGHLVFTSRVASVDQTAFLCDVDLESDKNYAIFYKHYWPYIHNIFLVVAFIVIIIGNVIITVHVRRSEGSKDIGEGAKSAGGGQGAKTSSKSRQLSLMLIIDSATIVICTLPFSIYIVVDQAFKLFNDSPQDKGEKSLVFAIVFYLLYVNRCANFFLYCVSGARFRQALKDILSGKSQKRKSNYVTGVTNTRNVTSSTFTADGEAGNRVSMNPMGPSASASASSSATNGQAKRISTSSLGPNTVTAPGLNGHSKLERHYGYGKTQNGK